MEAVFAQSDWPSARVSMALGAVCGNAGDFSAIASIGQDGKMSQPAAIGRFGLGFNAV